MQVTFVFTACSCRGTDVCKPLQFDYFDIVLNCKIYDLATDIMVDITEDACFLVLYPLDNTHRLFGLELFPLVAVETL